MEMKRAAARLGGTTQSILEATLLAHLRDAVVAVDDRGRIAFWNAAAEALFGWKTPEAVGRPVGDLFAPGDELVHVELDRALLKDNSYDAEVKCLREDGTWFWGDLRAARFARGCCVLSIRDAAARKRTEQSLVETDQRKAEFLAVLSHELRNPLGPIRNALYMLARPGVTEAKTRASLAVIGRQVNQLSRLVDDIIDVVRSSHRKIRLRVRTLDLNELVAQAVEDHRALFARAGVSLTLAPAPAPVMIDGDANRLVQVVGNLLQNALKFTRRGDQTNIRIFLENERVRIIVGDTGIGMAPQTLAHLFEPFTQADSSPQRGARGLGLGLALVKGLVEIHGGSIRASSGGLGLGSEITVELPLSQGMSQRNASPIPLPSGHRRVLVIEDNVDMADTLRDVLELHDHEVEVAYTGSEGIAKAHRLRPDVVLCDIGLPGVSGYDVGRALRDDEALCGIYLVAFTGYALPDDVQHATAAGFDKHLAKPIDPDEVVRVVANAPIEVAAHDRARAISPPPVTH